MNSTIFIDFEEGRKMKEKSYIQMVLAELGITSYEDYIEKIKIWKSFDNWVWHGGQEKNRCTTRFGGKLL